MDSSTSTKSGKSKGNYPQSIAWIYKRTIKLVKGEFKGKYVEKYYDIFRREMPNDLYEEYIKRRDKVMAKIAGEVLAILREKRQKCQVPNVIFLSIPRKVGT